jgi:hypothetical protein
MNENEGIIPYYVAVHDHNNQVLHVGYHRQGFDPLSITWKDNDTSDISVEDQLYPYFDPFLTERYGDDLEVMDGVDEHIEDPETSDPLFKTVFVNKFNGNYIYIVQIYKMTPEWLNKRD